ncbi:MAG TPA: hypothetical protein VH740_10020 [Vicinamibacterales bacterium]|jgi:hypothetical protein
MLTASDRDWLIAEAAEGMRDAEADLGRRIQTSGSLAIGQAGSPRRRRGRSF